MRRWIGRGLCLFWLGLLVGCAGSLLPVADAQGPPAPFPECEADAYAFIGRASLAELGLAETVGGPDAQRVGMVWVTAGPGNPEAWGAPPGAPVPIGRGVCVQWGDGSGMSTILDDPEWQPPGTGIDLAATGGPAPISLLALVLGLLAVAGVSFLAFRGRASRD